MIHLTPHMWVATASYAVLWAGLLLKRRRKPHAALMTLAILTDLGVVLNLQFERGAIQTAVAFTLSPLQQLHVLASFTATLLYIPVLALGASLYFAAKVNPTQRLWHVRIALTAFVCRSLGFLLMFSMLGYHKP
jgi:hypothetical protein